MPHGDHAPHFARKLGLRYVLDSEAGYTRRRVGKKGFAYLNSQGKPIRDERTLKRIRSLVIPPAWENVWICPHGNGHVQVTGRDARGRKQYRYHNDWSTSRNENKFLRLREFGLKLATIRARVNRDLKLPGMKREKILAAVVQTMELSCIRVGNEIYTRQNNSHGLTTIRNHHAEVKGARVRFRFRGKSGVARDVEISHPQLSRIIRRCQELPGQDLFGYEDDNGHVRDVGSDDVNDYLKKLSGQEVTAKDFRTWGGTVKAVEVLLSLGKSTEESQAARKRREVEVIKEVARHLGNTVTVCRKYYVDPRIFDADRTGKLHRDVRRKMPVLRGYSKTEKLLLSLLV